MVPAKVAGSSDTLRVRERDRYQFTIGLTTTAPFTFEVNVLGAIRVCTADHR
jgi:hypothetical protein